MKRMTDLYNIEFSPTNLIDYIFSAETNAQIALEMIALIGDKEKYKELEVIRHRLEDLYHYYSDEFCDEYE